MLIWFISNTTRPICFRNTNIITLDHLGAIWRSNKTAWMNYHIMKEWLRWFDARIYRRKVLFLMDNFSVYQFRVDLIEEEGGLRNTRVIWLPPNIISIF